MEKTYRIMRASGRFTLVLGVGTMILGFILGYRAIVHGRRLLKQKDTIIF